MLDRIATIEVYETPAQYPVPHRKPWARLASLFAVLLTLLAMAYVVGGILVQTL